MSSISWSKVLTPSRLAAILGLLVVTCAILIVSFSIGDAPSQSEFALRAQRLTFVHQTVESADNARAALRLYEVTQTEEARDAFLKSCDLMASQVGRLRRAEHMSDEQTDQIVELCVAIRQQINKIGNASADNMTEAGILLDRIRRVVLGFGLQELRLQDDRLVSQTKAASLGQRITVGMAVIEVFLVLGIVFLLVRMTRLEHLVTVCAWSHRLLYEGQWVNLEKYLEQRFGIRASEGITTEQAAKLMSESEAHGQELVRLIDFEKAAGERAKEASRAIHSVRNHLTAVLCYSEMASSGDAEAQREMAAKVLTHASTISSEVEVLHKAVRAFNPGPPDLHIVRSPAEEQRRSAAA